MFSMNFICVFFTLLICHSLAEPCHDGMVKFTKDSKLSCINGTWTARGCQTEDGQQLDEGKTLALEPLLMQCQKARDDSMKLVAIGCSKNGRILAPSQTLETTDSYYTCVPKTGGMSFQLSGCALPRPSNRKVPFDTTVQMGKSMLKCTMKDSNPKLEAIGCVHNNQTYLIDEKIIDDQYWYICEKDGQNGVKLIVKGCVNDLLPLNVGEIFHSSGIIYECQKGDEGIQSKITGCLEVTETKNIVEHPIGHGWTEGDGSDRVQVRCTENGPVFVN